MHIGLNDNSLPGITKPGHMLLLQTTNERISPFPFEMYIDYILSWYTMPCNTIQMSPQTVLEALSNSVRASTRKSLCSYAAISKCYNDISFSPQVIAV